MASCRWWDFRLRPCVHPAVAAGVCLSTGSAVFSCWGEFSLTVSGLLGGCGRVGGGGGGRNGR